MKTKLSLIIILLIVFINAGYSLNRYKSFNKLGTVKFKTGLSYDQVYEYEVSRNGIAINTGIEINIGKSDRFRFNPNITIGFHNDVSKRIYFHSFVYPLILEANFFMDIAQSYDKTFAWTLGIGAYGNVTTIMRSNTYWLHYGGNISTGFNLSPKNSRFTIEVLPLNLRLGFPYSFNFYPRLSLKYDL